MYLFQEGYSINSFKDIKSNIKGYVPFFPIHYNLLGYITLDSKFAIPLYFKQWLDENFSQNCFYKLSFYRFHIMRK